MVRPPAHSLAHRGTPATATHSRVRWQPYNPPLSSVSSRTPPPTYLVTPASSVSSTSPSPVSLCDVERPRHPPYPPRESQKSKYALGLVDQTVKSLCDIWLPQNIPTVFLTSGRPTVTPSSAPEHPCFTPTPVFVSRNTQLPSPISPTTQPSPVPIAIASYPPQLVRCLEPSNTQSQRCDVAPMRCFVHEVLRRSRTSGSVLQTALCYVEAIRAKIPDLVRREKLGFGTIPESESADRIIAGEVGIDADTGLDRRNTPSPSGFLDGLTTVRLDPVTFQIECSSLEPLLDTDKVPLSKPSANPPFPPLPPLPSPLLCPRRTFLASLILASKFMQDRCYSNRAWAKLSGLPPREIGRCERALGEALEWRLWVGKLPAAQAGSGRSLAKSRSEGDINFPSNSARIPTHLRNPAGMDLSPSSCWSAASPPASRSTLRRHATVSCTSSGEEPFLASWQVPSTVSVFHEKLAYGNPLSCGAINLSPSVHGSSPPTPPLSYSPTPTESSIGDRTVQMSSFMDVSTPPPGQFATFCGVQNDKVASVSNAPLVYSTAQDLLGLPPQMQSQYFISNSVVPDHGSLLTSWTEHV